MKISPITYLAFTTFILVTITIMASLNFAFAWVFYLMVIGQIFLAITVYKVLRDNYKTDKTFEHFYEDRPVDPIYVEAKNEKFRGE
ncbi:MAG: hypothetical protein AB8B52_13750 [Winogradskyella sp.]|uniref:hypothetical protein n=1 Tax=Winogradskyella sp. TaxID=1883156 RepID=UPI00385F0260